MRRILLIVWGGSQVVFVALLLSAQYLNDISFRYYDEFFIIVWILLAGLLWFIPSQSFPHNKLLLLRSRIWYSVMLTISTIIFFVVSQPRSVLAILPVILLVTSNLFIWFPNEQAKARSITPTKNLVNITWPLFITLVVVCTTILSATALILLKPRIIHTEDTATFVQKTPNQISATSLISYTTSSEMQTFEEVQRVGEDSYVVTDWEPDTQTILNRFAKPTQNVDLEVVTNKGWTRDEEGRLSTELSFFPQNEIVLEFESPVTAEHQIILQTYRFDLGGSFRYTLTSGDTILWSGETERLDCIEDITDSDTWCPTTTEDIMSPFITLQKQERYQIRIVADNEFRTRFNEEFQVWVGGYVSIPDIIIDRKFVPEIQVDDSVEFEKVDDSIFSFQYNVSGIDGPIALVVPYNASEQWVLTSSTPPEESYQFELNYDWQLWYLNITDSETRISLTHVGWKRFAKILTIQGVITVGVFLAYIGWLVKKKYFS